MLPLQGAQVRSLVGELKFHMLGGKEKKMMLMQSKGDLHWENSKEE